MRALEKKQCEYLVNMTIYKFNVTHVLKLKDIDHQQLINITEWRARAMITNSTITAHSYQLAANNAGKGGRCILNDISMQRVYVEN